MVSRNHLGSPCVNQNWLQAQRGTPDQTWNAFLQAPSREALNPCLPRLSKTKPAVINREMILEIIDIKQIGSSLYSVLNGMRESIDKGRPMAEIARELNQPSGMLQLILADGQGQVKACEYSKIPGLSILTPTGTKVCRAIGFVAYDVDPRQWMQSGE